MFYIYTKKTTTIYKKLLIGGSFYTVRELENIVGIENVPSPAAFQMRENAIVGNYMLFFAKPSDFEKVKDKGVTVRRLKKGKRTEYFPGYWWKVL